MNTDPSSRNRNALLWSLAGLVLGLAVAVMLQKPPITFSTGMAVWCADMALVLILSAHPIGARVGAVLGGASLVVPCFVWALPIARGLLACFMAAPFLAAAALLRVPTIAGFRARLGYLCSWCGTRRVTRRTSRLDVAALRHLVVATAVLAGAIAVVKAASAMGLPLPVRWLAGGIAIFAFGEMVTAGLPLTSAAFGVAVPQLFDSPYRSTSVGEFWTKRWNIAASQLFRTCCFAPLARRSVALALFISFLLSGIVHTLLALLVLGRWEISLVFGAFFVVQPLLIAAERSMNVRRWPPVMRRGWTLSALAVTSPLIVEPTVQIIEQSWGPPEMVVTPTLVTVTVVVIFCAVVAVASLVATGAQRVGAAEALLTADERG